MKKMFRAAAFAAALVLPLAAFTCTTAPGVSVVVTPANFVDVVVAKVKAECPAVIAGSANAQMVTTAAGALADQAGPAAQAVQVEQTAAAVCVKLTAPAATTPTPASSAQAAAVASPVVREIASLWALGFGDGDAGAGASLVIQWNHDPSHLAEGRR